MKGFRFSRSPPLQIISKLEDECQELDASFHELERKHLLTLQEAADLKRELDMLREAEQQSYADRQDPDTYSLSNAMSFSFSPASPASTSRDLSSA